MTTRGEGKRSMALVMSTLAFTGCFALWTVFSIVGVKIQANLGLNETEFGTLVGMPIFAGALSRLPLGIITDRFGGRPVFVIVMVLSAASTWFMAQASTYGMLLVAALGLGLAGGCFAVGVAYVSRWYDQKQQGTALGIFGLGNVGTSVTHVLAPLVLAAFGWQGVLRFWAVGLLVIAAAFWFLTSDDPVTVRRRTTKEPPASLAAQLVAIKRLQVWRFSLYYFFTFGAFVALSLWLPRYYIGVYHVDLETAGLLGAAFSLPGSVFRAFGGWLSDKIGARAVMYLTLIASALVMFVLSYPNTDYVVHGIHGDIRFSLTMGLAPLAVLTIILGFFMSLGSAAVYKHIPFYYPGHVGPVGGLVGMIGALGGFILPIWFGALNDVTNLWTSCFMLLFVLIAVALMWMHVAIRLMERRKIPELRGPKFLPELEGVAKPHAPKAGA